MLLGYSIVLDSMDDLVEKIMIHPDTLHIVSGNPEVLYQGLKNKKLYDDFTSDGSLIIPDGIGVCYPLRWRGYSAKRLAGIDLVVKLLQRFEKEKKKVYFLGGSPEVSQKMVTYVEQMYPDLKIVGVQDGYYKNEEEVVKEIQKASPDLLLVAMGAPKQELFIVNHRSKFSSTLMMGVGGTFDVLVGKVQRAPKWIIKLNMEWLYRVAKEPTRLKRLKNNILFVLYCIKDQGLSYFGRNRKK